MTQLTKKDNSKFQLPEWDNFYKRLTNEIDYPEAIMQQIQSFM